MFFNIFDTLCNQESLDEFLKSAEQCSREAKSIDELRKSLSVILTMKYNMTVAQAGTAIGRSPTWVANARKQFIATGAVSSPLGHGGRRNQHLEEAEEESFMDEVCRIYRLQDDRFFHNTADEYKNLTVQQIAKKLLEQKFQKRIADSTVFGIMSRVGKRKFKKYRAYDWNIYAIKNFEGKRHYNE